MTLRLAASEHGRAALERFPSVYLKIAHRRTPARTALDGTSDLLIEGFPRSGNSYLVSWIGRANPHLHIASHMHSIAHVHAALRRRIPVVVVIRPPEGAIASLGVYDPKIPLDRHVIRYRRFHERLVDVADDVIISPFPLTTEAPQLVSVALAAATGLTIEPVPPGGAEEALAEVDRRNVVFSGSFDLARVSRPSDVRKDAIDQVRARLRARYRSALTELDALHDRLATWPTAVVCDAALECDVPEGNQGD